MFALSWLRARLFSNWSNSLVTLAILYLTWKIVPPLIEWAFIHAVWSPENPRLCRDAIGHGACWAFIADKYRFILFGTFPFDQQWRPALVIAILVGLYALSALRGLRRTNLVSLWLAGFAAIGCSWGGLFGLSRRERALGWFNVDPLDCDFGIGFAFRFRSCWR
jgi:general L-amino acid transport system permease protein